MELVAAPSEAVDAVLFRPAKKRKIYRQRVADNVVDPTCPEPDSTQTRDPLPIPEVAEDALLTDEELEGTRVSMAEILRLRKLRKHRGGGVEFRASAFSGRGDDGQERDMVLHVSGRTQQGKDEAPQEEVGVGRRFAKQTGMVGDVDKHMMAYIDSELAKGRLTAISLATSGTEDLPNRAYRGEEPRISGTTKLFTKSGEKQPAALGKLLEIDLGNEARDRNVMRTEQARRRLEGEDVEDESAAEEGKSKKKKRKKPKLGRDGKPWRERKRRTSEDIRRDKLVEEVLRENKLDNKYATPPTSLLTSTSTNPNGASAPAEGEAADEQIAEAFKREFLDAVSQRHRRRAAPSNGGGGAGGAKKKKKEDEILRGPKLGGSRAARAAMREAQLKELKGGRK